MRSVWLICSRGGFIRGFLNDGSVDYKSHHSIDSLAFGHCEYSYRNLGRPTRLAVRQSAEDFRVDVDGKLCFDSKKIKLPLGYSFGISAASAETPDSFEIFKFVTTTESHTPDVQDPNNQQQYGGAGEAQSQNNGDPEQIPALSDPPEIPADTIRSADAQFADLHNRLQAMMKHISALTRDLSHYQANAKSESNKLADQLARLESSMSKLDGLANLERKIDEIKGDVRQTKNELHNSLDKHVSSLKTTVRDTHHSVIGSLAANAPSVAVYVFVVLGSQALLVVAYVLYKRRKANGPKKYL
jgi:mannose-binding lectin 1